MTLLHRLLAYAFVSAIAMAGMPTMAKEVAGIAIPDSVTVNDTVLKLNGAGVRKRFFIKVYVGALYLKDPQTTSAAVLAAPSPRSVRMHILYDEISAAKLVDAWNEGFAGNTSKAEVATLQPRIAQFNALFPAVKKGDVVRLDLVGDTTEVWINQEQKGAVAGPDFQQALLKIWLGEKPVDASLKRAMLGS